VGKLGSRNWRRLISGTLLHARCLLTRFTIPANRVAFAGIDRLSSQLAGADDSFARRNRVLRGPDHAGPRRTLPALGNLARVPSIDLRRLGTPLVYGFDGRQSHRVVLRPGFLTSADPLRWRCVAAPRTRRVGELAHTSIAADTTRAHRRGSLLLLSGGPAANPSRVGTMPAARPGEPTTANCVAHVRSHFAPSERFAEPDRVTISGDSPARSPHRSLAGPITRNRPVQRPFSPSFVLDHIQFSADPAALNTVPISRASDLLTALRGLTRAKSRRSETSLGCGKSPIRLSQRH
jgi:hypothetical protein